MFHVIAIDAGGTKTLCLLADDRGTIVSSARGSGANLQAHGELQVEKVVHEVMDQAIGDRDIVPAAICIGIAGVDRPGDRAMMRDIMKRIGFQARIVIVNDALIALEAGLPDAAGVVVVAGTGSIAYGRDAAGRAARAGGWGHVLADEGSGYWLGRQTLRVVMRAADGRGPATALTPRLLTHFGVSRPQDFVREVYESGTRPSVIASLAKYLEMAVEEGDVVAREIIDEAAHELSLAAAAVTTRLALTDSVVVLAGGMFKMVPALTKAATRAITERAGASVVRPLDQEPAVGAVRLAIAMAHGHDRVPVYVESQA